MRHYFVCLALVLGLGAGSAHADSLIKLHAPNGIYLMTDVAAGYGVNGSGALDPALTAIDFGSRSVDPAGLLVLDGIASSAIVSPPFGNLKDRADITAQTTFEFGMPFLGAILTDDVLSFNFSGVASALTAQDGAGNDLFAGVVGNAVAYFYLDPLFDGTAPGTFVGVLNVPALPAAGPGESMSLLLIENSLPVAYMSAGDGPAVFGFTSGNSYAFNVRYTLDVPFGVDPAFNYSFDVHLSQAPAVPEPSTVLLILPVIVPAAVILRRRFKAA